MKPEEIFTHQYVRKQNKKNEVVDEQQLKFTALELRMHELTGYIHTLEDQLQKAGVQVIPLVSKPWIQEDFKDFLVPYRIRAMTERPGKKRKRY